MAIADGVKTADEVRRQTNARKIKHRANRASSVPGTDKKELANARAQNAALRTQNTALQAMVMRQVERQRAAACDGGTLSSERDALRVALGKIEKLLTEARGLSAHFVHNRTDIIAKISRAKMVASTALQTAGSADKRAA